MCYHIYMYFYKMSKQFVVLWLSHSMSAVCSIVFEPLHVRSLLGCVWAAPCQQFVGLCLRCSMSALVCGLFQVASALLQPVQVTVLICLPPTRPWWCDGQPRPSPPSSKPPLPRNQTTPPFRYWMSELLPFSYFHIYTHVEIKTIWCQLSLINLMSIFLYHNFIANVFDMCWCITEMKKNWNLFYHKVE